MKKGQIRVSNNPQLCYVHKIPLWEIAKEDGGRIEQIRDATICGEIYEKYSLNRVLVQIQMFSSDRQECFFLSNTTKTTYLSEAIASGRHRRFASFISPPPSFGARGEGCDGAGELGSRKV